MAHDCNLSTREIEEMLQGQQFFIADGTVNFYTHFRSQYGSSSENWSTSRPSYTFPWHIPKGCSLTSQGRFLNYVHSTFNSQKLEIT